MGTDILWPINPPLATPPRTGLLATFRPDEVPEREVGFIYFPENCGDSGVVDPCDVGNLDIPDNQPDVQAEPFGVWAGDKCLPDEVRDFRGRASRQLAATISYQIAHELWTGSQAQASGWSQNRFLTSERSDVLTDGPTSSTDALARLEYALGQCMKGSRGVIHATKHAVTFWSQMGMVRREGAVFLTIHDTYVIADAGYDGSGPYGPATDDSQWAYATGIPVIRIGPESIVPNTVAEGLNRGDNLLEYRAQRKAAVSWDQCCHLAAELDLGWAEIGGAGS